MGLIDVVFGRPLASSEDSGQRITPTQGIPTFGLDALSSAAYGPEAALTILLPLGMVGIRYVVPLTFAVIGLLLIVYFSYRQTIAAYPNGGGSYTVARENLGSGAGLLAGAQRNPSQDPKLEPGDSINVSRTAFLRPFRGQASRRSPWRNRSGSCRRRPS